MTLKSGGAGVELMAQRIVKCNIIVVIVRRWLMLT